MKFYKIITTIRLRYRRVHMPPAGIIVRDVHDIYSIAEDDTAIFKEPYIAISQYADGSPYFTIPLRDVELLS